MKNINIRFWVLLIIELIMVVLALFYIRSCALDKKKSYSPACSGDAPRTVDCPAGQAGRHIQICKDGSWQDSFNDCKAAGCTQTVFDTGVAPIITANCKSCHATFVQYDTAKAKVDHFINRITSKDVGQRMPKGLDPLAQSDIDKFTAWKNDGLLAACPANDKPNPFISLDDQEQAALKDINSLNSGTQTETRWIDISAKSNEGATQAQLKVFAAAVQKGLNQISLGRNIILAKPVDKLGTLLRFNLNDIKFTVANWNLIEANDPLNLESNTNVGTLLKQLTNSKKPIMGVEAFLTSALKANVYYTIKKIPTDLNTLLGNLGVNEAVQLGNFQAAQVGFANSPISLNKNRLLVRFDSNDGALWQTFDTDNIAAANKNLFAFPLLKSASGKTNFNFQASEILFHQANGLLGAALFDAAGKRLDAAALNIVAHDTHPPADPTIKIQSCGRCHNGGLIPKKDEVKNSINPAQFDLRDVDLIDLLYRDPSQAFKDDNAVFGEALAKIGVLPSDPDPVTVALDSLQERTLNLVAVASLVHLTPQDFSDGLKRSADGLAQVGTLLSGGSITFSQFIATLPILIRDLRLGQEPLTPGG